MKKKSVRDELVTKGYLTDTLSDFREGLVDQMDERNKKYFQENFDKVMIGQDKIMKELETIREENAAGTLYFERLDEKVEDHEKRITRLESPS